VGEWWSILILRDALYGLTRFDEFQKSLGIAPNMLTRRLNGLVETGLLERRLYSERPPRHEYRLTERGRDFQPVLVAMLAWGNRHFAPEGTSVLVVDGDTGKPADPIVVDRATGKPLLPPDYVLAPGPAASDRTRRWHFAWKKLALSGLVAFAGIGVAWYGHHWWTVGRFVETTDDAYVGGEVTVVAPRVAGLIAQVAVTDNQAVHAGDLLVKLDDRDYRAALDKAAAAVAAAEATLANLDAVRRLREAMIAQAEAEVAAADAEGARSELDLARYRELNSAQYASAQRFQQADADQKKAAASVARARAALAAARRELEVVDTQKAQARAALAQAEAERDLARLDLEYTELRAPVDGVVGNRSARAGAYASVGAQLLAVVPSRGLWVDANFKESQLADMRPGQPVSVAADVLPGEVFSGYVASLAPATGAQFSVLPAENATGNFTKIVQRVPVRIQLDGSASTLGRLRPGLSVTVTVDERLVTSAER
jgi:membrane fusion protein (multidrug efflux system)